MNKDNPQVSVIIPTYNCRPWIGEAIDSVLAQSYSNYEIIVVDDGSTDGTGAYLQEVYGEQIRYVYQENKGRGAARNAGLRLARGQYIQFLDADDLLAPHKLELHVAFLNTHLHYAVVYGRTLLFNVTDKDKIWEPEISRYYQSGNLTSKMIDTLGMMYTLPTLVRKSCLDEINGFDESMERCEDYDLWLRIAYAGAYFGYLQGEAVGYYRKFPNRLNSNPLEAIKHNKNVVYALEKFQSLDKVNRYKSQLDKAIARAEYDYGRALLLNSYRLESIKKIFSALPNLDRGNKVHALIMIVLGGFLPYDWIVNLIDRLLKMKYAIKKSYIFDISHKSENL